METPTNLHRDLGRMEGKLDAVLSEFRATQRTHAGRLDEHEKRIESLEADRTERRGALKAARLLWGVGAAGVGVIGGWLGNVMGLTH